MVLADIFHRFSGIGEREYPLSTERYSEYARRLRGGEELTFQYVMLLRHLRTRFLDELKEKE